ncbi:sarcoplasmic calcium-binding protein [Lingula anatina]|uniref:Sarcoplasmic calcium-binding protein n=1 Tax=Lingula anatina TaxID=7574 RepID=A0A1S3HGU0_LINAN|nr:sarcoplasmic calcium-binding protein [Lingula anatina]XP_013379945.1 sarcoplasmic calcium-binding protein [Lingula anatina]XP_013379946.1 sarcoplasmic calcium-binding protein [Lingula anatina]XP_013379947.1 sarcoplasmic calcium-binding protein [Lingula anatina]XP_013385295.1 sarcoplasmic calcium-binding protein [Lingula anatina]XP_013385296.1 sarcoplasmic calcium-binding protein [Lingula anatina]XP_013385298.1 sarcoplasmic calcium-binding protein [Lingula anatina]|eukprot:XP_013379944.1 sarcoplasmic calcium-binding protein [Lingula anatina]
MADTAQRQVEFSDIWLKKMKTVFHRFSVNKDGKLNRDAGKTASARYISSNGLKGDQARRIREKWQTILMMLTTRFTAISEEQFINSLKEQINTDAFRAVLKDVCTNNFDLINVNQRGNITKEEMASWCKFLGQDDVDSFFEALDTKKDGVITADEWQQAWNEFYFSEDESSLYNKLFGPLAE